MVILLCSVVTVLCCRWETCSDMPALWCWLQFCKTGRVTLHWPEAQGSRNWTESWVDFSPNQNVSFGLRCCQTLLQW